MKEEHIDIDIDNIAISHYLFPDGGMMYGGTINYKDGEISACSVKTNGKLQEFFIEHGVSYELWEKCKPITRIEY